MATIDDLERGNDQDDALEAVDQKMPEMWAALGDQSNEMLALLLLDRHYGLNRPDDYLLVNQALSFAVFMFDPVDAQIAASVTGEDVSEDELEALNAVLTQEPFEIRLSPNPGYYEEGETPDDSDIPEELRGQVIRVRLMTEEEQARDLPHMATVRANGDLIYLPGASRPTNVGG